MGNPDSNFRYDPSLGGAGGGYSFNLSTKGLTSGTYLLGFKVGSAPLIYTVQFKLSRGAIGGVLGGHRRCALHGTSAPGRGGTIHPWPGVFIVSALTLTLAACSLLGDLGFMVQPPRFDEAQDQPAEIRLVGPA